MSESNTMHKVVDSKNGKIRGIRQTTLFEKLDFYAFKGIPFAKPPIGDLRFKAPVPIDSWKPTVLDAFEHGKICFQPDGMQSIGQTNPQSEDCLFLNIYVPANVRTDEKLAVMVYIHGGGFAFGSGNEDGFGPDFLIEKHVIIATLNYRLGMFGFLSLGTPEYSGNMGLKDQQLALKWIHSNIEYFSGDNERITVFGQSAGGVSTHFQILSSESREYFQNAIPMSGSVDNFWAFSEKNDHLDLAHKIAADLGQPKASLDELIEFFKTVPAEKIVKYASLDGFFQRTCQAMLAPVIEPKDAIRPFIVDLPSKIYDESKIDVNVMFTLNSNEFISFYSRASKEISDLKALDANFTLKLPFREANLPADSLELKKITKEIREFYFHDVPIDEKKLVRYMELLSDVNFAYGIDKSARQHAIKTNAKTYYYRFDVDTRLNMLKRVNDGGDLPGSGHAGDKGYFARALKAQRIYDDIIKNKNDQEAKIILRTIDNVTKLLSNFAKYGEPTRGDDPVDGFLPIHGDQVHYLDVNKDGLHPGINLNRAANELWARIEQQIQQINADARRLVLPDGPDYQQ